MALNADESGRLAGLLDQHADQIIRNWTRSVATSLRGRLSEAELQQQVRELHQALQTAASGDFAVDAETSTELRAVLAELSRHRARQGFSTTETAISIFALKDRHRPQRDRPATAGPGRRRRGGRRWTCGWSSASCVAPCGRWRVRPGRG